VNSFGLFGGFGGLGTCGDARLRLGRTLRRHLRQLVVTTARSPMLMRGIMNLVGTRLEMRLLVVTADGGHVAWLLGAIDRLAMLAGGNEHHRLGKLTRLGVLMHHHGSSTARARISAMRLWRCRLGVGMPRVW